MADMTTAQASQVREAVRVLEQLEKSGDISPAEMDALRQARQMLPASREELARTATQYMGMKDAIMLGFDDEISGARKAVADFVKSGDTASASEAYNKYRDLARDRKMIAQQTFPEEFSSGGSAGALGSLGLLAAPGIGGAKLIQNLSAPGKALVGAILGTTSASLPEYGAGTEGAITDIGNVSPITAGIGAGLGLAAPAAGAAAGYGARAFQDIKKFGKMLPGFEGRASRLAAGRLQSAERAGEDIKGYLSSLGPEGMIADIPGSPMQAAQSLAAIGGEGADIMGRTLRGRSEAAGGRIKADINEYLGKPTEAFETRAAQASARSSQFGPMYDAAKAYDKPINVDRIRELIVSEGAEQSKDVRSALNRVLSDIGKEGDISARQLHNARSALDDAVQNSFREGKGGKGKSLKTVLDQIDTRLDLIPNYADARVGWANTRAIDEAVDEGRRVFSGGATTAQSPQQIAKRLSELSPAQREAYRAGAREYVDALMGTSRSDAPAAWGAFQKEWNEDKLRLILGNEAADPIIRRLKSESDFATTRSKVLEGSQTGFRTEGADAMAGVKGGDAERNIVSRAAGAVSSAVNRSIDNILFGAKRSDLNRDIGRILSLQGDERDAAVRALMEGAMGLDDKTRAQQIIETIVTGGALAAIPQVTD